MVKYSEEDENKSEDQADSGINKKNSEANSDVFTAEKDSNESSKADFFPEDKEDSPLRDEHKDSTTSSESLPPMDRSQLKPLSTEPETDETTQKEPSSGAEPSEKTQDGAGEEPAPTRNPNTDSDDAPEENENLLGEESDETEKPKKLFERPPEEWLPIVDEEDEESNHGGGGYVVDSGLPVPPDGGWGWMVVFASFMIHVFADGFTYTFGIFYVSLLNYYGASKAEAAWIVSILVGVTLGSGPISGTLVNKFGCSIVTIAGAILSSVMLFVSIFAPTITTLYFTIGIGAGFGFGLIYLPAIVCVTGYFEKKRSFATGIAVCGSGLGTFVFSPLVEVLIASYNWKGAMVIISGLMLNCVFFGSLFRPLEPKKRKPRGTELQTCYSQQSHTGGGCSPEPPHSQPVPSIEITDASELRNNISEVSLQRKLKMMRLKRNRTLTSPASPVDNIQRISSHGFLNPVTARRPHLDNLRVSASQPLFTRLESIDHPVPLPVKHHLDSHPRLLNRKDIFYSHSLLNIPEYKHNPSGYREAIVKQTSCYTEGTEEKEKVMGCIPCSKDTMEAIHSLTDWGLLKDPIFQLFALSNFLTSIGFNAPYVFIVDRALDVGIDSIDASSLLAIIGISNTVSRVVLGYISDRPFVNRLYLYNAALTICGLGTCVSIWMNTYAALAVYAAVFGSMSGAYVGLTSVVLVDLLGMERLTNAFGLVLMFQGIASCVGPPLCASLYKVSNNYTWPFILAGSMIALSGVILFAIPPLERCVAKKQEQNNKLSAF